MRAFLERLRSPAQKAIRDAGPPHGVVIVGFGVSGSVILVGWWAGPLRDVPWPLWALIPVAILTAVTFVDRDGWNIRRAMAYVAIEQRARWPWGQVPRTAAGAQAWLDDPAHVDADGLQKVSMLITLGNLTASRSILDAYVPATPVQAAGLARLRAYFAALDTRLIDMAPIRDASEALGEDDRRYQLAAAAWMQAWMDIEAHRPWRQRFADSVRELAPFRVPGRVLAFIGIQQLSAPIATAMATMLVAVIAGW